MQSSTKINPGKTQVVDFSLLIFRNCLSIVWIPLCSLTDFRRIAHNRFSPEQEEIRNRKV
jgi:hypothetical protein